MNPIENLLRRRIGLDATSVGSSLIERTIRLRMKALGITTLNAYQRLLESSPPEWDELVEAVVVTETWFFRDHEPFRAFAQLAQEQLRDPTASALRVLSLPCSTGEEPYSLAMALLDAGVPRERFVLDAVDLSTRALARAKLGLYGKNSFRGQALGFRDGHFARVGDCHALNENVKTCVAFHRGNLLEADFCARLRPYHFIFCRNLLIYFDRATQGRALQQLHRLLAPHGVLFVGPAEMPLVTEHGFAPAGLPMAFASRKAGNGDRKADATARKTEPRARNPVAKSAPGQFQKAALAPVSLPPSPSPTTAPAHGAARQALTDLNAVRALADAGKLAEAASLCDAHLKAAGPSAQAYYLLGLVNDAAGDPAALDYYRKAIYLEPNHYETLLQLALLLEKNGDPASRDAARGYKRRAERAQAKLQVED